MHTIDVYYYYNEFIHETVGIVGERMRAGVVYGPAVNMPDLPTYWVPVEYGVDGLDGKTFMPEYWQRRHTERLHY